MRRLLATLALLCLLPRVAAAQAPAETIEYYAQDAIGSIRVVFSPAGTVLARQDYAPFGRQLFTVPAMPKEGYGAQEKDDETDQAYFHARMFQARTGRFTRPDPIQAGMFEPQRWNRYAYALNRPLTLTDASGLDPCPPGKICGTSTPACTTFDCDSSPDLPGDGDFKTVPDDDLGGGGGGTSGGGGDGGGGQGGETQPVPTPAPTPVPNPPTPGPSPPTPRPECDPVNGNCGPSVAAARVKGFVKGVGESCMVSYARGVLLEFAPVTPSATDIVFMLGPYAQQAQMNRALAYAASRPNVIGGQGLLMPFRSSTFRGMYATAQGIGAKWVPALMAGTAVYAGVNSVINDASAGRCK